MDLTCGQDDAMRKAIKRCANKILIFAPSLNISKNLPKIKAKEVGHVMEAIVNLIQVTLQPLSRQIILYFLRENHGRSLLRRRSLPCKSWTCQIANSRLTSTMWSTLSARTNVFRWLRWRKWYDGDPWSERRWCSLKTNQRLLCQKCFTWMISDNQHILPVRCDTKRCFQNCFGPSLNIISQISLLGAGHQWERHGRRGCAFACKSSSNQHQAENCSPR